MAACRNATLGEIGRPAPSREEAKAVYEADLREKLEGQYFGQFVAIEPESRNHFVAVTFVDVALAAKAAHPNKKSFVIRIGFESAVHIGAAFP